MNFDDMSGTTVRSLMTTIQPATSKECKKNIARTEDIFPIFSKEKRISGARSGLFPVGLQSARIVDINTSFKPKESGFYELPASFRRALHG